jgi:hypothetical protein
MCTALGLPALITDERVREEKEKKKRAYPSPFFFLSFLTMRRELSTERFCCRFLENDSKQSKQETDSVSLFIFCLSLSSSALCDSRFYAFVSLFPFSYWVSLADRLVSG